METPTTTSEPKTTIPLEPLPVMIRNLGMVYSDNGQGKYDWKSNAVYFHHTADIGTGKVTYHWYPNVEFTGTFEYRGRMIELKPTAKIIEAYDYDNRFTDPGYYMVTYKVTCPADYDGLVYGLVTWDEASFAEVLIKSQQYQYGGTVYNISEFPCAKRVFFDK